MALMSLHSTWPSSPRLSVPSFYLLIFCCWLSLVSARRNITVDADSTFITYHPASSWGKIVGDRDATGALLDAGGGHMLTQDPNAYATLTITYVSFWVMSTKWPYVVTTEYVIDGTNRTVLNLEDPNTPNIGGVGPATAVSSIVASFIGSSTQLHEIGIFVTPGGRFAVLDRLIFEVEDDTTSSSARTTTQTATQTVVVKTTPGTSTSPASQSSTTSSPTSHSTHTLAIALGIALPLFALGIIFLMLLLICRRRSRPQSSASVSYADESEKTMYNGGDGFVHTTAAPAPGPRHAASYDKLTGATGYGVPSGPRVSSHSSIPGAAYPQTQRPPYPEISDVPDSYNPYAEAGYVPPHAIEAANLRRS